MGRQERFRVKRQRVDNTKALRIGDVEDFPAELELVAFGVPHLERLAQTGVERDVAGQPQLIDVAIANLAGARATDGSGTLQPEPFSLAQPDGASGWNSITVKAQ